MILGKLRSKTTLHILSPCFSSELYWVSLQASSRLLLAALVIAVVPHNNWEVTQRVFNRPSERLQIQPLVYITVSKLGKKKSQILLYDQLHICKMLSECFGTSLCLYADFSCYRITSWQNNAWQELIKNWNMNPCRAHWGKFVTGTIFLCLREQKLGLTVPQISSFGSVWTHCYSVWLFLQFSLW